jgi:hypothetical protein
VAPIPEAWVAGGHEGGRIALQQLARTANTALAEALGPGEHVSRAEYTQIYLSPDARQRVAENPAVLKPVLASLERLPGVLRAMPSAGLEAARDSADPVVRAAALSHVPGRSGQIVIVPQPYYIVGGADATTHGTQNPYDQHVPLIFFGAGVVAGQYATPSTPADLTPTLASRIGLSPLPAAEGVAQSAIFKAR